MIRVVAFAVAVATLLNSGAVAQGVGREGGSDITAPTTPSGSVITQPTPPKQGPSGAGYNSDGSLYFPDTRSSGSGSSSGSDGK